MRFWCQLDSILAPFSRSWGILGASWAVLEASWAVLGPSWAHLGASWHVLVRLGRVLGRLGAVLALKKNPPASDAAKPRALSPSRPPPYNQPVGLTRNGSAQSASRHPPASDQEEYIYISITALFYPPFLYSSHHFCL